MQMAPLPATGTTWFCPLLLGAVVGDPGTFTFEPGVRPPAVPGLQRAVAYQGATFDPTATSQAALDRVHTVPDRTTSPTALEFTQNTKVLKFVNMPSRAIRADLLGERRVGEGTDSGRCDRRGETTWNLRNRKHQFVASGVYFYHNRNAGWKSKIGRFTSSTSRIEEIAMNQLAFSRLSAIAVAMVIAVPATAQVAGSVDTPLRWQFREFLLLGAGARGAALGRRLAACPPIDGHVLQPGRARAAARPGAMFSSYKYVADTKYSWAGLVPKRGARSRRSEAHPPAIGTRCRPAVLVVRHVLVRRDMAPGRASCASLPVVIHGRQIGGRAAKAPPRAAPRAPARGGGTPRNCHRRGVIDAARDLRGSRNAITIATAIALSRRESKLIMAIPQGAKLTT